jgi:hypothetical protein
MSVLKVEVQYGFSEQDKYTHRMLFLTQDVNTVLGNGGALEMPQPPLPAGGYSPIAHGGLYLNNYLTCLQEVCQPGVQIIAASVTRYITTDWGIQSAAGGTNYDVIGFTPKVGNLKKAGPRGRAFIGARQPINSTHRYGWMRWHFIAGNLMSLPTLFAPEEISPVFAAYYANLRVLGGLFDGYGASTNTVGVEPVVVPKDYPSTVLHFGIRNG